MSDLSIPEHWIAVKFKQVVLNEKDGFKRGPFGSALKKEFFVKEGYQVYEQKHAIRRDHSLGTYYIGEKKFQELKGFAVNPNDFIVSCSGTLGRIYKIPHDAKPGIINQALLRLRINKEIYTDRFFELFFTSSDFQKRLLEVAPGSAQVNMVGVKVLKEFDLPLPPMGEQERIVKKIESYFQKLDQTEKALLEVEGLLTKYRESFLAKAFRGELAPQDPKDEPVSKLLEKIRAERTKNSNGQKAQNLAPISDDEKPFDLPTGWEWVRLTEVCSLIADIDHKMPKAVPQGVIFLSAKDLKDNGVLDFSNPKYISREDFKRLSRKVQPQRGDIIYSRIGARLGKARVVNVDTEFIVSYSCCTIRPIKDLVDVNFLNSYLDSGFVLDQALRDVKGIGVPDLGMDKIKNFVVPLPSINTQISILEAINLFETNIKELRLGVETKIQLVSKLKESLLTNAFQGLLVPRVLNEGTGQELLAKILESKQELSTFSEKKVSKKITKKTANKKADK